MSSDSISLHDFVKSFELDNRDNWYNDMLPYIIKTDDKEGYTYIRFEDGDYWAAFLPEELKPDHQWKFKVGDLVTDGKDRLKIVAVPPLDVRRDYPYYTSSILEFGNKYAVALVDDNNEIVDNNDTYEYLHLRFNEKELKFL